jgi:hypothetical protein
LPKSQRLYLPRVLVVILIVFLQRDCEWTSSVSLQGARTNWSQEILSVAQAQQANHIVMGTKALGPVGRFILGSTTQYVLPPFSIAGV